MTIEARKVLEECYASLEEIRDGVQGEEWKRRWLTTLTLLRSVGHVLDKVDGTRTPGLRKAIDDKWNAIKSTKPDPLIYWEFIEKERNQILKTSKSSGGQGVTVVIGGPVTHHYTINSGPFKGREQRDVLKESIKFWVAYLDEVDKNA